MLTEFPAEVMPSTNQVTKPIRLLRDVLVATVVSLLFLGLAECALRVAGVKFEGSFYNPDRELGYVLRPNAEGWNVSENVTYFRVNSDGMADREHTVQRAPGVIRIAIVGDSVTEAKHVPREAAYWAVMERRLNNSLGLRGQKVEVLNFGVAGYGLAQEAIVIQERVWKYDPQIVVLAGSIESFILRSTRRLSPSKASEHVPFYVLKDGKLQPDFQTIQERTSFKSAGRVHQWVGDLMNASRVLGLLNEGLKKAAEEIRLALRHGQKDVSVNSYKESDSFLGPARPDLAEAWDVSEALILRSRDEARQHQAEFWFFTLDMPQQVDPDSRVRAQFQHSIGLSDPFTSDNLFANFAKRDGILHGALAPQLLEFAEKNNIVLHGFPGGARSSGHWNETGHRAAGELLAQQLLGASPSLCCVGSAK